MIDYKSKRWELKRNKILKRDKYICQESKRYGKRIDAEMVHHIWPADDYPEYAWEDWNLISLSNKAHNKMHVRSTKELTAIGEALRQRTPPPQK